MVIYFDRSKAILSKHRNSAYAHRQTVFYLTYCLTFGAFGSLNGMVYKYSFSTDWHGTKTTSRLPSTVHITASTSRTPQSPSIFLHCNNYYASNKMGALIKITNYAKGVIQQTGRHIEKTSWFKSRDNFNLKFTFFQHLFLSLSTHLPDEPFFYKPTYHQPAKT